MQTKSETWKIFALILVEILVAGVLILLTIRVITSFNHLGNKIEARGGFKELTIEVGKAVKDVTHSIGEYQPKRLSSKE